MPSDHVDVLIVGAGLAGIGAAHHLTRDHPGRSFAILEARQAIGGTWDLFRYPGIRSDSDMYTLGYSFRPWTGSRQLADGPSILEYVRDTAREGGIEEHIRFGHRVTRAEWSSEDALWTVHAEREGGGTVELTASFVIASTGYYSYTDPYVPDFAGREEFGGRIVHPQLWSDDIDYEGRTVVVIGSGATAVTLVPALAERAAHVTMLQRSPTYIFSVPGEDAVANAMRRYLPAKLAYALARGKNVALLWGNFQLSRRAPGFVKGLIRRQQQDLLPDGYDIDTHFKPGYGPWDQRLCVVPDADLFEAISAGRASVVTDHIDTFTENGIRLRSGAELDADLVITATGLELLALGGMEILVDGEPVDVGAATSYKGIMLCGVPNLAMTFGYSNASWTLKCDLTCEYVGRLLAYMDGSGFSECRPMAPEETGSGGPFMDLSSGYVQRGIARFPRQGPRDPWRVRHNYPVDRLKLRRGGLQDEAMRFRRPAGRTAPAPDRAPALA